MVINGSYIFNGTSLESGGGAHMVSCTFSVFNSEFQYCSSESGGGIFVDSTVGEIRQCRMHENEAFNGET